MEIIQAKPKDPSLDPVDPSVDWLLSSRQVANPLGFQLTMPFILHPLVFGGYQECNMLIISSIRPCQMEITQPEQSYSHSFSSCIFPAVYFLANTNRLADQNS